MNKKTKIILVIFVSVIFSFILGEIILRFYGILTNTDYTLYLKELKNPERLPSGMFTNDSLINFKLTPNKQFLATTSDFSVIYKINSKGIRDKNYPYKKNKDNIRILALGDSFTFGEGINYGKRFTDLIESKNIEVINSGVPGYGLDQELVYFMSEGIKYNPDYVFIFLNYVDTYRNNVNLSTIIKKEANFSVNDNVFYIEKNSSFYQKDTIGFSKSYLFSLLKYNFELIRLKKQFEKFDESLWNSIFLNYNKENSYEQEKNLVEERTKKIIDKFLRVSNKKNITLVIIKIDTNNNLNYIESIPNLIYFDLGPNLFEKKKKESLTFKYDPHFNKETNLFISENVKKIMLNLNIT